MEIFHDLADFCYLDPDPADKNETDPNRSGTATLEQIKRVKCKIINEVNANNAISFLLNC